MPFAVVAADLNRDGELDLAVSNAGNGTVSILLATRPGEFAAPIDVPVCEIPRGLAAADLNRDGVTDLALACVEPHIVVILLGDGRGGFDKTEQFAGVAPFQVAAADLDGDGALDLGIANESDIGGLVGRGEVTVLFGDGRGRFPSQLTLRADTYPAKIELADLDGDQWLDLVVVNWGSQNVSLFLNRTGRSFVTGPVVGYGGAPAYSLAVVDLDRDRRPDILVGDVNGSVWLLHNRPDGSFTVSGPILAGPGLRSVVAADLDGDQYPDIATANTSAGTASLLLGRTGGDFEAAQDVKVGAKPRTIIAADFDRDGRNDLAVANGGSDDVSVLMQHGERRRP